MGTGFQLRCPYWSLLPFPKVEFWEGIFSTWLWVNMLGKSLFWKNKTKQKLAVAQYSQEWISYHHTWHKLKNRPYWGNTLKSRVNKGREIMVFPSFFHLQDSLWRPRNFVLGRNPSHFSLSLPSHKRHLLMKEAIDYLWSNKLLGHCLYELLMNPFCPSLRGLRATES